MYPILTRFRGRALERTNTMKGDELEPLKPGQAPVTLNLPTEVVERIQGVCDHLGVVRSEVITAIIRANSGEYPEPGSLGDRMLDALSDDPPWPVEPAGQPTPPEVSEAFEKGRTAGARWGSVIAGWKEIERGRAFIDEIGCDTRAVQTNDPRQNPLDLARSFAVHVYDGDPKFHQEDLGLLDRLVHEARWPVAAFDNSDFVWGFVQGVDGVWREVEDEAT